MTLPGKNVLILNVFGSIHSFVFFFYFYRGTISFFAVCGLDVLNSLHLLTPEMRKHIIDWTYGSLVIPQPGERNCSGFQVSVFEYCLNIH